MLCVILLFITSKSKLTKLIIGDTLFTDSKYNEGKTRPKLTDAVFNKEVCNAEITLSHYTWIVLL